MTEESGARPEPRQGARLRVEPPLQDLLDDPMMRLVWRRDGLEPTAARATVRSLQELVRAHRDDPAARGRQLTSKAEARCASR